MDVEKETHRARIAARIHLTLAGVWIALFIPTVIWWKQSILWVLSVSLYANVVSHIGAYQGAKAAEVGAENP